MPDNQQPVSDLSAVLGGQRAEVSLIGGERLSVHVRALPARTLLTDYLALVENEAVMLEKVCVVLVPAGEPGAGWIDLLTDASHAALVEIAEQLNFDRAAAQAERQAKRMQGLKTVEDRIKSLLSISPSAR